MASNSESVPNDDSRSAAQPWSETLGSVSLAVGAIQVDSSDSSPDNNGLTSAGLGKKHYVIDGKLTKTEYEVKNKGLFVVISNTSFNYKHNGHDWSKEPTLNYGADEETLKKTFNLADDASNFILGCDLTSEDPEGGNQFDVFMDNLVKDNPNEPRYDFLVFVLMSHGLPGGKFLLAEERESPACCGSEKGDVTHKYQGYCHVRDIKKDMVKRIQDSRKFLNIPKIFLVQTCRGDRMAAVNLRKPKGCSQSKPPSPTPIDADEFIPEGSDTYIMFACYEDHLSYVGKSGSLLVKYFCEAVDELQIAIRQSKTFFSELEHRLIDQGGASNMDTFNNDETMRHRNNYVTEELELGKLFVCPENLIGGWMENVAQKTMAKITKDLIVTNIDENDRVLDTEYDKQQPHISSTLRFKLSMLKVLRTQWDDMQ
ncbi:hypothetical protein EB796_002175 [Bugula neritina]|uniref:Caspase family p20 domain-containing protein n=1 Tax=Bugula neritina TaxID=10212 RepID=A0A7J7KMX5_BUGNE|nr:hypothetical protein EB796_002175 [Bugula neritina]